MNRAKVIRLLRELLYELEGGVDERPRDTGNAARCARWRKRGGISTLWRRTRLAVIWRDGLVCGICGMQIDPSDVQIDHRIPVSRGGTSDLENLRPTHSRCNQLKGDRLE